MNVLLRIACCAIPLLYVAGCAGSSPRTGANDDVADSVAQRDLDVLFATEYPVADKAEAIARAESALRKDNNIDKALFFYVRALQFDSADTDILMRIGNLHIQKGNLELARRAFGYAAEKDPYLASAAEGQGVVSFRLNDFGRAETELTRAVQLDQKRWRAQNYLGVIEDRRGNHQSAQLHYDRALIVRPDEPSVLINRGYSKYLAGNYRAAELDLQSVAAAHNHPRAWSNLALVYGKQGRYETALDTFLEVFESAEAHRRTGTIALENEDYEEAVRLLDEAIRLSPKYFPEAEEQVELARSRLTQRGG